MKTKEINNFSNAKVGDLVTDIVFGVGVIKNIDDGSNYPIKVNFNKTLVLYTTNGRHYVEEIRPRLYKGHLNLSISVESIDPFAELKKAYAEGKEIEVNDNYYGWVTIKSPNWDCDIKKYRIKPEKKYQPYTSLNLDLIGKTIKGNNSYYLIVSAFVNDSIIKYWFGTNINTAEHLFENYTFLDGTPIGELTND